MKIKYPLVLVEREDSQQPIPSWQWVEEYQMPTVVYCRSVGYMISKTKLAIALAPNLGGLDTENVQGGGIMRIPRSAIRKISNLKTSSLK